MEPRSTRDIEILFKLIVKVPVVGNSADTPNPPGLLPLLTEIWESPRAKENLAPVGFEPTTSGLDLLALYQLSYVASTLTTNLNSISISQVLHGSTTIYLYHLPI